MNGIGNTVSEARNVLKLSPRPSAFTAKVPRPLDSLFHHAS